MGFAHSHLQAAARIISGYEGTIPFPDHARAYFRMNKQHGGRDRKTILTLCYAHFRMGASLEKADTGTRAITGLFLSLDAPDRTLQELDETWNALLPLPLAEKLILVRERHPSFSPEKIFPWSGELGGEIDPLDFSLSHLVQPDLFVRIRPGNEPAVMRILDAAGLRYEQAGPSTLRFRQGADLSKILTTDKDLVVQDLSSQRVAELMRGCGHSVSTIWDCCAGSGGKTLLLHDLFPQAKISASDVRPSILNNLHARLDAAGITGVKTFPADLAAAPWKGHGLFDLVVADVPCTGSGTWGRNPEWLTHFDPSTIATYSSRQKAIAGHAALALKQGGCFLYVTCSVFRQENEEVVAHLQEKAGLHLEEMSYLKGFDERADTLFGARFTSPA